MRWRRFQGLADGALEFGGDDLRGLAGRADVHGVPRRVELRCQARGLAQDRPGIGSAAAQRHGHLTHPAGAVLVGVVFLGALTAVEEVRALAQRHLAQAREVLRGEEIRERLRHAVGRINLARLAAVR